MAPRFQRPWRSWHNGTGPSAAADPIAVPPGAVLMGRRMIDEGHSPEDVEAFLSESFRRIDVQATLDSLYERSPS